MTTKAISKPKQSITVIIVVIIATTVITVCILIVILNKFITKVIERKISGKRYDEQLTAQKKFLAEVDQTIKDLEVKETDQQLEEELKNLAPRKQPTQPKQTKQTHPPSNPHSHGEPKKTTPPKTVAFADSITHVKVRFSVVFPRPAETITTIFDVKKTDTCEIFEKKIDAAVHKNMQHLIKSSYYWSHLGRVPIFFYSEDIENAKTKYTALNMDKIANINFDSFQKPNLSFMVSTTHILVNLWQVFIKRPNPGESQMFDSNNIMVLYDTSSIPNDASISERMEHFGKFCWLQNAPKEQRTIRLVTADEPDNGGIFLLHNDKITISFGDGILATMYYRIINFDLPIPTGSTPTQEPQKSNEVKKETITNPGKTEIIETQTTDLNIVKPGKTEQEIIIEPKVEEPKKLDSVQPKVELVEIKVEEAKVESVEPKNEVPLEKIETTEPVIVVPISNEIKPDIVILETNLEMMSRTRIKSDIEWEKTPETKDIPVEDIILSPMEEGSILVDTTSKEEFYWTKDIEIVQLQTKCTKEEAVSVLNITKGDVVEAIMRLTSN